MTKFIVPFITSFLLTSLFSLFGIAIAKKIIWKGRDSSRHIHNAKSFRIGGVVMTIAFIISLIIDKNLFISHELYGVMAALFFIMIFGIWDDIEEIVWKVQIFFQVAVSILIFIIGVRIYYITNPFMGGIIDLSSGYKVIISFFLVVFWLILMMNSMNWIDGIDGLSGGITFIGALTIFFLSLKPEVNQPPVAIIAMALAGVLLGFLVFNFYPSRIMAGTAGSMFMGFALAVLAIFSGTKIATSLLVMTLPVVDFFWVIIKRIRNKKSIFIPDRNHLHFRLLDFGWSQKKIALTFYLITGVIALIALNTRTIGKALTLFFVSMVIFIFIFSIEKKLKINGLEK